MTLAGFVSNYWEKLEAEKAAKRVSGVKAVANDIEVKLTAKRTDPEIARAAVHYSLGDRESNSTRFPAKSFSGSPLRGRSDPRLSAGNRVGMGGGDTRSLAFTSESDALTSIFPIVIYLPLFSACRGGQKNLHRPPCVHRALFAICRRFRSRTLHEVGEHRRCDYTAGSEGDRRKENWYDRGVEIIPVKLGYLRRLAVFREVFVVEP